MDVFADAESNRTEKGEVETSERPRSECQSITSDLTADQHAMVWVFIPCPSTTKKQSMGLITGMQCALSLGIKDIVVQGDSKLVLEH